MAERFYDASSAMLDGASSLNQNIGNWSIAMVTDRHGNRHEWLVPRCQLSQSEYWQLERRQGNQHELDVPRCQQFQSEYWPLEHHRGNLYGKYALSCQQLQSAY